MLRIAIKQSGELFNRRKSSCMGFLKGEQSDPF